MKIAKMIALAGLLAMTGILIYGFTIGDFAAEGAKLLSMPWGIVSLVDLYVGFALFSCWIVFREKALLLSLIHISEPTRLLSISYAVFCLKKKKLT